MISTIFFVLVVISLLVLIDALGLLRRLLFLPDYAFKVFFRDKQNRVVFYHGVNICNYSKHANDFMPWHQPEDYDRLKQWGFNLVRFLVYWEAIEPIEGEYNNEYLQKVVEHIDYLRKIGIDVIVDIHQDLYAKKFNGNGFPEWTVNDKGKPFSPQEPWGKNYLQPAVRASYRNFWESEYLQKKYAGMMSVLASYLKGLDNVIGIDMLNEPFPKLPFVRYFEKSILTDFYKKCITFVVLNGYYKTFFFQPWIGTSSGIPTYMRYRPWLNKAVYMPHYYPPRCLEKGTYKAIDRFLLKWSFNIKHREAQLFNSPLIFGEFGISSNVSGYQRYVWDFLDLCNKHLASWIWWSYDKEEHSAFGVIDNEKNEKEILKTLVRAYPQRIAGESPIILNTKNTLYLTYRSTDTIGPTVVYVPDAYNCAIDCNCEFTRQENQVLFENSSENLTKIQIRTGS
jgi:endoglycosylceramidase